MQHYFIDKVINEEVYFKETDYHHIINVMRFKVGDEVIVNYLDKQYLVSLTSLKEIKGKIIKEIKKKNLPSLTLIMSYIKNDKFEFVLQKSAELNVTNFIPYFATRSIIKLNKEDYAKKLERYNKISKEACEQCERVSLMNIFNPIKMDEINKYTSSINILIDELEARNNPSNTLLKYLLNNNDKDVTIIIGPEGGFDDKEREYLHSLNFVSLSLTSSILRAETAVISALSIINAVNEGK